MVEFETIKAEEVKFGKNSFIEISRRKVVTPTGENEFIAISRGYYLPDESERFKKSLTIPDDEDIKKFIANMILEL